MFQRNLLRKQVYSEKRKQSLVFLLFLIVVNLYLLWSLIFDDNGLFKYLRLKEKRVEIINEINLLERENSSLKKQIKRLKEDPYYMEKLAREQLNLSRPDEFVFIFKE
ncbi:MAG: septum formation initiator family protein [Nitrospirae bacterium]|nr:MAG: septum formation initiator family protein [Nitrospirota bacterium]